MADASAEINLSVDYDGRGVNKAKRDLRELSKTGKGLSSVLNSQRAITNSLEQTTIKWKKSFDQVDKAVKMLGKIGLKGLSLSIKGVILEMGLMAGAMLAVHGAFLVGNAAMKAMRSTLAPLAAGMTAVVAAASAAAAAVREQQAAMWAYKNTAKGEFGSGLNQVRQQMRALHSDTYLASVGVQNLNTVFATVSKTGTFTQQSQNILKGLMDFAAAGQPIEEGIKKAGDLIAILQDSKKSFSEAKTSAQALFPDKKQMDKALKELKITTKAGLEKAIMSGSLAGAAGVEGQFDAVSGTLINRLKGYFNVLKVQFGDLGQPLLEPLRQAAYDIFRILQRGLVRISGNTQRFGMTAMLEGLVSLVDKLTTMATDLINNNLHAAEGTFDRMANWWDKFTYGWDKAVDKMRPFVDGARVIEKMFGQVWKHVKEVGSSRFGQFNEWLQQNQSTVMEFGNNIGGLLGAILKFQGEMSKLFQDMLPFINNVVSGVTMMVEQLTSFIGLLKGMGGGGTIGALGAFAAMRIGLGQMKNTKGGAIATQAMKNNMTVNAQSVVVNAPGMPSSVARGGNLGTTGAAMGGLPSTGRGSLASRGLMNTGGPNFTPSIPGLMPNVTPGQSSPIGANTPWYTGNPRYQVPQIGGRYGAPLTAAMQRAYNFGGAIDTRTLDDIQDKKRFSKFKSAIRHSRTQSRMGKGIYGDEATGRKGIQGSMGAKMGVTMGLGMLSQIAPQEAQGALALGGAIGMFNPLAGLGVGLAGTALKSQTATGGALTGIAGGATLGAMVGGPVGAAVGAILGGVTGAVMGTINRNKKESKQAREAARMGAESIIDSALSGIFQATRGETGVGRSATRDIFSSMKSQQDAAMGAIGNAQGNLSGGFGGFLMNRSGLRGNTITKGIEDLTGKELPGAVKAIIGVTTKGLTDIPNMLGTAVSKLGGKRLVNSRTLNPLGFGANNRDDRRAQTQKSAIRDIYRNQERYGTVMSEAQLEDALKKPGAYIEKFSKDTIASQEAMGPLQEKYNSRLDQLGKITGKTDQEVISLAKTMDVNLFDSTVTLQEQMEKLGLTTVKTAEQFNTALIDGFTNNLSVFDASIKKLKAPRILDETARAFGDMVRASSSGQASEEQKVEFMKSVFEQNLAMYGNATQAFGQFMLSFGKGGTAYSGKGPLSDIKDQGFYDTDAFRQFADKNMGTLSSEVGSQLNSVLASMGQSVDVNQLRTMMEGMSGEQLVALGEAAQGGFKRLRTPGQGDKTLIRQGGAGAVLEQMGLGGLGLTRFREDALNLDNMAEEVATQTTLLIKKMADFFEESDQAVPSWYKTPPSWWKAPDTSTPRGSRIGDTTTSKLSQTMGRHASMDGMLTGKRTVTSAYRNFNLGSMNSDHVTGRAYDLTGQNLGQYQSLVRSGGGFAEFHGVNGGRHLHVVPGSGIGDRATPVAPNQTKNSIYQASPSGGNTYQFYVTGGSSASPEQIAEMVMVKVKQTERSNRERM